MSSPRALSFVSTFALASLAATLLGAGCSSDSPPRSDGPLGATRAGATLATAGFVETTVFGGHDNPTVVRFAADGRAFVAEKNGRIYVYDGLTDATPTLFANLQTRVHDFWDRGLLGMTLDPAFPTRPYVYVLYAYDGDPGGASPKWGDQCPTPPGATADGCVISGRLSRFTATGDTAGAETVLIEGWRQQYPSHATGQVEFGPDGALYASGGDGASFNFVDYGQDGNPLNPLGDPPVAVGQAQTAPSAQGGALRSQSVRRPSGPVLLNGSVIRVDPDTGLGMADNPLAGSTDVNAQRVVAYGLRNPFRIAARPGSNELWIADVGWNQYEEVNRILLGGASAYNFGWPCYEGASKQPGYDELNLTSCETLYSAATASAPFFAYKHSDKVSPNDACGTGSSSVTGLAFYTGGNYPAQYQGAMFFADYSRRCIYVMPQGASGDPEPANARSFHVDADGPVFLTTGPGGDIFYAALNSGTIQRIRYLEPAAAFTATPSQGQVPLIVSFDGSNSVKPLPDDVLSYAWDLDGDGAFDDASDPAPAFLYDAVGNYSARLKVTDQRGTSNISAPLVIHATAEPPQVSTPPVVVIDTPSAGLTWKVGDTIQFTGHATDAEDGVLPPSALSWQVVIQHCPAGCHIHDLLTFDEVASGSFVAEDHDYPMHLELILTATDSSGQKRTARLPLEPHTVSLVFDTEPSGLDLVVGSTQQKTSFARRVIVGSENSIAAPETQAINGATWKFQSWSDGQPRAHTLSDVTKAARYVAKYSPSGGLRAEYYDQLGFTGVPLTRVDSTVDFDWRTASPAPSLSADTFSVRWTGALKADFAETYTFSTLSDDGVRVLIDGASVIDHFDDHAPSLDTADVALSIGWHAIAVEYYEQGGGAEVHLSWSSPSVPEAIVPESHLRPGCNDGVCPSSLSCSADDWCVPACDSSSCTSTQHCTLAGASCVSTCTGLTCPSGDKCSKGLCVDACTGVTCTSGKHCELGKCVLDPLPPGEGGAGGEAGAGGESGSAGSSGNPGGGTASGGAGGTGGNSGSNGSGGVIEGGAGGAASSSAGEGGVPSSNAGEGGVPPSSAGEGGLPPGTGGEAQAGGGETSSQAGATGVSAGAAATATAGEGGQFTTIPEPGGGGAGQPGDDSGSAGSSTGSSGSCSCRTAGAGSGSRSLALLGFLVAVALGRRRRRS
jgi:MYXO-CTERM domain-containing protein